VSERLPGGVSVSVTINYAHASNQTLLDAQLKQLVDLLLLRVGNHLQ
jgi:hypothetical protein